MKSTVTLLLIVFLLSGCNSTPSKQPYTRPEPGLSLERPDNWSASYYKRNGATTLKSDKWIWDKDSATVSIWGPDCYPYPSWYEEKTLYEQILSDIERIRNLYYLDSVTILQQPMKIKTGDYEYVKAEVAIPAIAMGEYPAAIQVRDPGPNVFQKIEIFIIKGHGHTINAYIYKSDSDVLNTQAQEIIDSIRITCE